MKLNAPRIVYEKKGDNLSDVEGLLPTRLFLEDKEKIKQIVPMENCNYTNISSIAVEGVIDDKIIRQLNATEITIQVPDSLRITIDDISSDIEKIGTFKNTTYYSQDNRPFDITTKHIVFHCIAGSRNIRKITGTPIHVSDFLVSIVSRHEAHKAGEEKRRDEVERKRLEVTDRRLESAKKDALAEIERVEKELISLKEKVKDADNNHDVPDVYTSLYPEEDC